MADIWMFRSLSDRVTSKCCDMETLQFPNSARTKSISDKTAKRWEADIFEKALGRLAAPVPQVARNILQVPISFLRRAVARLSRPNVVW